jgi:nitrite reductase (NADH) small subunit
VTPGAASSPGTAETTWTAVCRLDQIAREEGVAALVEGQAVAVFRTHDDQVFALSNYDPFSRASVLSRGIVGTRTVGEEQVAFVASPMLKQAFALRTGQCLDDETVRVATYAVRVDEGPEGQPESGTVHVGPQQQED